MLFGPGGVVALVIGAWGVLWALRSVPGRPWRAWGPTAGLFVGTMLGTALLSAHTETVLAVVDWVRATPEERDAVREQSLAIPWKPLLGALLGTVAVAAAAGYATWSAPPEGDPPPVRAADLVVLGSLAVLSVSGVVVLVLLRGAAAEAMTTVEAAVGAGARLEGLGRAGAVLALVDLGVAVLGGARRAWQARAGA